MRLGDDGAGTTEAGQIRAGSPSASSAGATGAGGIRVDTHVQAGATVPPYYDSLLAKVIAQAGDRDGALAVLRGALDRCVIDGVTTNLGLQRALLADPEFAAGGVDTGYLARRLARGLPGRDAGDPGRGPGADGHGTRPGEAPTVRDNAGPGPDARGGGDG
jgi:acetyl/propionyl-CoA carboxylase alpha subunit